MSYSRIHLILYYILPNRLADTRSIMSFLVGGFVATSYEEGENLKMWMYQITSLCFDDLVSPIDDADRVARSV